MRGLHWKRSENAPTGGEDESEVGTSRHFAALQQLGRFRSEADIIERFAERYEYAP
jgi:hypothetical protein